MSSVWDIYYTHWAKDANASRFKRVIEKGKDQSIKKIWSWFNLYEFDLDPIPLEECMEQLLHDLSQTLPEISLTIQNKMKLLQELVDCLVVCHTPDDHKLFQFNLEWFSVQNGQVERTPLTPSVCLTPAEVRFRKNSRIRDNTAYLELELKSADVRRLDAVLALF